MRLKLFVLSLTLVFSSLITFGIIEYYVPHQSIIKALAVENPVVIDTKAFTAIKEKENWLLTIKKDYYPEGTETVALTYNDIYYGIFLITDRIFLPVLVMPEVSVVISPLDKDGNPLIGESFTIGEKHDSASP